MRHVSTQGFERGLRIAPGLDRQHFYALGNQHRCFALDLGAVLQVFNGFNALGQLHLEAGKWLFGQRRTCFGGITLPGQSIGEVEFGQAQKHLGFFAPFGGHLFLASAALELVEFFLQRFGRALVAIGEVFVNLSHLFGRRVGGQPIANPRRPLAGRGSRKRATCQTIQRMRLRRFGSCFCSSCWRGVRFG